MKKITIITIGTITVLLAITFPFLAFGAPAREGGAVFSRDVQGKEWILLEFRIAGKNVRMDRQKLEADFTGGVYTISFREGRVSGVGAPNRFFSAYTTGSNRALGIERIASTLMAPFREPDDLKERDYFNYLSRVTRWDFKEGKLELCGSNDSGAELVLVFIPK